jgi:Tfp pilus assembly protein PilN
VIPLYGFVEGDTIGLVVLADEQDTMADLARRLQESAALRVAPCEAATVWFNGAPVGDATSVEAAGMRPLDRFDVRGGRP